MARNVLHLGAVPVPEVFSEVVRAEFGEWVFLPEAEYPELLDRKMAEKLAANKVAPRIDEWLEEIGRTKSTELGLNVTSHICQRNIGGWTFISSVIIGQLRGNWYVVRAPNFRCSPD